MFYYQSEKALTKYNVEISHVHNNELHIKAIEQITVISLVIHFLKYYYY